jgi:hypothetical protein
MQTLSGSVSPTQAVLRVIANYWEARCLYIAAKLGLADLVRQGPKTAAELAVQTGTHAPALYRVLRALASTGWFYEDDSGRFRPTSLSAGIQSDAAGSLRFLATTELGEEHYPAWGHLMFSVRTGKLAFDEVFGMPNWEYWAGHAEHADVFNRAMSDMTAVVEPAVLASYDFSRARTVVDVGGGKGTLMSAILRGYPQVNGIVLDLPHVVAEGRALIAERRLDSRCTFVAGSFFDAVPRDADVYVLKWVLHDWDDERCVAILKNCREAMADGATLVVVEAVIPARNEPSFHKLMDVNMLVMTGGRERTEAEYRMLFETAGFSLDRVTSTPAELSVLEGRRQ